MTKLPPLEHRRLGPRLAAVAAHVPTGARVADIGSDHARLPCALVASGRASRAWALDVAAGPVAALRSRKLPDGVEVRQGDGMAPLRPQEADVVTICGMGGHTVARILMGAPRGVWAGLRRLVLQPNDHAELARAAVVAAGWGVVAEQLIRDRSRWYPVVVAAPAGGWRAVEDELALRVGPVMLQQRDPALRAWLSAEHARACSIVARAPQSDRMRAWARQTRTALERMGEPRGE